MDAFTSSKNICRCCLTEGDSHLLDMNEMYEKGLQVSYYFETLTGITSKEIEPQTKLCRACKVQLIKAYDFKQKAVEAHQKLQGRIKLETEDNLDVSDAVKLEPFMVTLEEDNELYCEEEKKFDRVHKKLKHKEAGFKTKRLVNKNSKIPPHKTISSDDISNRKPYICDLCDHSCLKKLNVLRHLIKKHFPELNNHLCDNCGQKFPIKSELHSHVRVMHKNEKLYKCNQCPRAYLYLQSLKVHLTSHSDLRQFVCETCSAAFKTRGALFNHRQRHLEPKEEYVCQICGSKFAHKTYYEKHFKETHLTGRQFSCPDCGKMFKAKRTLEGHQRIHDGNTLKCSQCPKEFYAKDKLEKHFLCVHSGQEKQFKCQLCTSEFYFNSKLNRHLKNVHKLQATIDKRKLKKIKTGVD